MDNKAMFKFSYGLFVLTAAENGKDNGCIINTAGQVTAVPNRVSVCVNKDNFTHGMIQRTGKLTLSIIGEDADFDLFTHFGFSSGKDTDKFNDFPHCKRGENGILAVTKGTNAAISVKVLSSVDLGTHTMFIGDVTDCEILTDAPSATYQYYFDNIKPAPGKKSSDMADKTPSAVNTESTGTSSNTSGTPTPKKKTKTVWRCIICGFEYEGETLPPDYICPLCKHPASDFEKIEVEVEE